MFNIICVSGMVFGAIHCVAWNFLFPTHAERILWRVASIGILFSLSTIVLQIWFWMVSGRLPPESIDRQTSTRLPRWLIKIIEPRALERSRGARRGMPAFVSIAIYYVPARVSIIVLMFLSLVSLPPGAYDTVVWTKFFPYLNL